MLSNRSKYLGLWVIAGVLLCFSHCRPDKIKPKWKPGLAVPVVNSNLTVRDVLLQSNEAGQFIQEDSAHFLTLVYSGQVFSQTAEELMQIEDQGFQNKFKLPNLKIRRFLISGHVSLGQIAQNLNEPERSQILNAHNTTATFPAVPTQSVGKFAYQGNPEFVRLSLTQGNLKLTITNNLPVAIENVQIDLVNNTSSTVFAGYSFSSIPAYSSRSKSASLAGKTVTNEIGIDIKSISSPGSGSPVPIDTSDAIGLGLEGTNLVAKKGEAKIPFQVVSNYTYDFQFQKGERIRTMTVKSGTIRYRRKKSSFDSDVKLALELPYARNNGNVFVKNVPINSTNAEVDLGGYTVDFTLGGTTYNAVHFEYGISSKGKTVQFNSGDSIRFSVNFRSVKFSYLDGYIGKYVYNISEDTVDIPLFKRWKSGHIFFKKPRIDIITNNSYGLPLMANFSKLNAYSGKTKQKLAVSSPVTANPVSIKYPTIQQVGKAVKTKYTLDKKSSNLKDIIAMPPTQFRYDLDVETNPSSDSSTTYFVTDQSQFNVDVNVAFPLYGRIENLVLQDTFAMEMDSIEVADSIVFYLQTENSFPLGAEIQLYFTDHNYHIVDSLLRPRKQLLPAARIDKDGKVLSASKQQLKVVYNRDRKYKLMEARYVIVEGALETANKGQVPVRLYSYQGIGVKLGVATNVRL